MDLPDDLDEFLRQKDSEGSVGGGQDSNDTTISGGPLSNSNITGGGGYSPSKTISEDDLHTSSTNSEILNKLAQKFEQQTEVKVRKQPAFWLKQTVGGPSSSAVEQKKEVSAQIQQPTTHLPASQQDKPSSTATAVGDLKAALGDIPTADQSFASSNLHDLSLSLNDTDDEKDAFFKRIENQTEKDSVDYAQLNRNLADDSIDLDELPTKMKVAELTAAAAAAQENQSLPTVQPSTADEQEDWDSIQSNIDFIESSHVFSESDISFEVSGGQSKRASVSVAASADENNSTLAKSAAAAQITVPSPLDNRFNKEAPRLPTDSRRKSTSSSVSSLSRGGGSQRSIQVKSASLTKLSSPAATKPVKVPAASADQPAQLMRELQFLQDLLDKEQDQSRSLRSRLEAVETENSKLAAENTIISAELDDLKRSAVQFTLPRKDEATEISLDSNRAQMEQQDRLIQGYQVENERLVTQLRDQKVAFKQAEQEWEAERQRFKDQLTEVNTRVVEFDGRSSRQSRRQEDDHLQQLEQFRLRVKEHEAELNTRILELEAEVKKLRTSGEPAADLEDQLAEFKQSAELRAVEAREREAELAMQIGELEAALRRSEMARRSELPQTAQQSEDAFEQAQLRHRQREAELNTRLIELEAQLKKHQPPSSTTGVQAGSAAIQFDTQSDTPLMTTGGDLKVDSASSAVPKQETAGTQVDQIREDLERKLSKVRGEHEAVERKLRADLTQLRVAVREKDTLIDQLRRQLEQAKSASSSGLSIRPSLKKKQQQQQQKQKVSTEAASKSASTDPVETADKSSGVGLIHDVKPLADTEHQSKVTDLQLRQQYEAEIRRLKTALEEAKRTQSGDIQLDELDRTRQRLQQIQSDYNELSNRMRELEAVNSSLQMDLQQQQQRDQGEVVRLKRELQTAQSALTESQQKLVTSETVRQTLHEQFKQLLRQAQETTVETALAHHDQTIARIRQESQQWAESETQSAVASLQHQLTTKDTLITSLREQVDSLTIDLQQHRDRLFRLERQLSDETARSQTDRQSERERKLAQEVTQYKQDLETAVQDNRRLERELNHLRQSLSPSAVQYHQLWSQLEVIDERLRQRETKWERLLQTTTTTEDSQAVVEKVRGEYEQRLRQKDDQLISFRQQLDGLVRELMKLRRNNKLL